MEKINYWVIGLIAIAVIGLIIFLVRRNQKDEQEFEKDASQSEIRPEKHEEHGEKI